VLLGLNKCGNPSVTLEAVAPTEAWNPGSCEATPGFRAEAWAVADTLGRGWAVATVHQNAIAEDRQELAGGLAIARWAGALADVAEALDVLEVVDAVVAVGHSRRGKAALLAAARSEAIAAAVAHQSGTAGAALSRHLQGEPIESITGIFPHWLHPDFAAFAGRETFLPVDQHLLLAAIAPRPVLVTDGADDAWADPEGARQAVELAAEIFDWLGAPGDVEQIARPGDHALTADDWQTWIDWLEPRLD
jgi:dienelactone hydrolase